MDGGAWWAAVHGVAKSRTRLSDFPFTFHFHAWEKAMATPLQCSCLENPRDGGAWWAAVCGVAQSRTRLKRLSSSSSTEKLNFRVRQRKQGAYWGQNTRDTEGKNTCSTSQRTRNQFINVWRAGAIHKEKIKMANAKRYRGHRQAAPVRRDAVNQETKGKCPAIH